MNEQELRHRIDMTEDALSGHDDQTDPVLHRKMVELLEHLRGQIPDNSLRPDEHLVEVGRRAGSPAANQYGTFQVYAASERQVNFLASLIRTKDTGTVKIPSTLEGISKTAASALIERLIDRPYKDAPVRLASEKQVAFLVKLAHERVLDNLADGEVLKDSTHVAQMSSADVSKMINFLLEQQIYVAPQLESGIYQVGDKIYKVYTNQERTRMLAKLLVLGDSDPTWLYQGMAYRYVKSEHKMTLEQAKKFGVIYGVCCSCGATLTDETSIAEGIGPVCAKKWR